MLGAYLRVPALFAPPADLRCARKVLRYGAASFIPTVKVKRGNAVS